MVNGQNTWWTDDGGWIHKTPEPGGTWVVTRRDALGTALYEQRFTDETAAYYFAGGAWWEGVQRARAART